MKTLTTVSVLVAVAMVLAPVQAAERSVADGLTAAGVAYVTKGNVGQARELFYKALANDETCPDALFELAKLTEKDSDFTLASELYQRAASHYASENKPGSASKKAEAEKHVRTLNPAQPKLTAAYEEYAQDLDKVVKKLPDPLTEASAMERISELKLATLVTSEKMPKFYTAANEKKAAAASAPPTDTGRDRDRDRDRDRFGKRENPKNGTTSPEVQAELKALGWGMVTGAWVKKAPNMYEATDAKLEAQKTNGMIDFWIVRDNNNSGGIVKATVRTERGNDFFGMGPGEQDMSGYGILYRVKDFRNYGFGERGRGGRGGGGGGPGGGGPGGGRTNYGPTLEKTLNISETPKSHFIVRVEDTNLEFYHNDSRSHQENNVKLPKTGTFVLDVNGTVIIELPKVTGN